MWVSSFLTLVEPCWVLLFWGFVCFSPGSHSHAHAPWHGHGTWDSLICCLTWGAFLFENQLGQEVLTVLPAARHLASPSELEALGVGHFFLVLVARRVSLFWGFECFFSGPHAHAHAPEHGHGTWESRICCLTGRVFHYLKITWVSLGVLPAARHLASPIALEVLNVSCFLFGA